MNQEIKNRFAIAFGCIFFLWALTLGIIFGMKRQSDIDGLHNERFSEINHEIRTLRDEVKQLKRKNTQ